MERETEHVEQEWVWESGAGARAAPGPPIYVPGGCAQGWTVGKTKCYLFVPQTYSRDACTAFCQSQGALSHAGSLISPLSGGLCTQSQEEAEFLTLHSAYSDSAAGSWLNYDRDASGVWRWGKGCARSGYEQVRGVKGCKGGRGVRGTGRWGIGMVMSGMGCGGVVAHTGVQVRGLGTLWSCEVAATIHLPTPLCDH
jgi:hypothetical protein